MASNKKTVPFYGTEEQKEQLLKVIQELRDEKGCLMPIMQKAQEIYGYLPIFLSGRNGNLFLVVLSF